MVDFEIIAIIPARKGSKRVSNKNIHLFKGIPLIAHSILYANSFSFIKKTYVSTDCSEISRISKEYGAEIIERPSYLATDEATTSDTLIHAVSCIESKNKIFVLLQPTNPLRPKNLIEQAIDLFCVGNSYYDSLVCVSENKKKLGIIKNNLFHPKTYSFGQRTQDLEKSYSENGLLYLFTTNCIKKHGNIFGKKVLPYILDHPFQNVDIDEYIDFEWAEFISNKFE